VPLIEEKLVNRTIPHAPKAPNQKYLITILGKEVLKYLNK